MGRKFFELITVLIIISFASHAAHAVEIYYLGAQGVAQGGEKREFSSYSLKKRIQDLLDFSSTDISDPNRSGYISGTIITEIAWKNVGGNESKSFLNEGVDYLGELHLGAYEKLWKDYHFEGLWFLRKTDDPRVESRNDVRLKQMNLRISNSSNLYEFGDFYGDFSPFVLASSLQGFNINFSPNIGQQFKLVAARKYRPDQGQGIYQRNVFGAQIDLPLFQNKSVFRNAKIGFQAVTVQDDSSTINRTSETKDLENTVVSVNGEFGLSKYFDFSFEFARAAYKEDEDAPHREHRRYGNALMVRPGIRFSNATFTYLLYYVEPDFRTDVGSAMPDKIQHELNFNYRFNSRYSINIVENYYWDKLTGSNLDKRTVNNEQYVTFYAKPFDKYSSLLFRTYFNYQRRDSDDSPTTVESNTLTVGTSLDNSWGKNIFYGMFYEYRNYDDEAQTIRSEYFHRAGIRFSQETYLFGRRLYYTLALNSSFRKAQQYSHYDSDIDLGIGGQYDFLKNMVMRFGHNVMDANGAPAQSDYVNRRSYLELDLLQNSTRNTHVILRGERNTYNHQNNGQDYAETIASLRFVSNF